MDNDMTRRGDKNDIQKSESWCFPAGHKTLAMVGRKEGRKSEYGDTPQNVNS